MTKKETTSLRICVEELTTRSWIWISLPEDNKDLWDIINDFLDQNNAEEWAIADIEGFGDYGVDFDDIQTIDQANELAELLELYDAEVTYLLNGTFDLEETLEILETENYRIVEAPTDLGFADGDLAHQLWNKFDYWMEIPEELENYINWEDLERDLLLDDSATYIIGEKMAVIVYA